MGMTPYQKLVQLHGKSVADAAKALATTPERKASWDNPSAKLSWAIMSGINWGTAPQAKGFWQKVYRQATERRL